MKNQGREYRRSEVNMERRLKNEKVAKGSGRWRQ